MWTDVFWKEWRRIYIHSNRSYEQVQRSIVERCNTDFLPLAVVAFIDGEPVGTGCLKPQDLAERSELTPWLAGIFVLPKHRRQGIGSQIVRFLEIEAARLGHSMLYLWTPSAAALYESLGWRVKERITQFENDVTIMEKILVEQADAANPHAFGTFGISPAEQARMPKASGDT